MDRGAQATVHRIAKSQKRLKQLSTHACKVPPHCHVCDLKLLNLFLKVTTHFCSLVLRAHLSVKMKLAWFLPVWLVRCHLRMVHSTAINAPTGPRLPLRCSQMQAVPLTSSCNSLKLCFASGVLLITMGRESCFWEARL